MTELDSSIVDDYQVHKSDRNTRCGQGQPLEDRNALVGLTYVETAQASIGTCTSRQVLQGGVSIGAVTTSTPDVRACIDRPGQLLQGQHATANAPRLVDSVAEQHRQMTGS